MSSAGDDSTSSTGATASAPSGNGAPVATTTAWPDARDPAKGRPGKPRPTTRSLAPGLIASTALTATPSSATESCMGFEARATGADARNRPRPCVSGTSSSGSLHTESRSRSRMSSNDLRLGGSCDAGGGWFTIDRRWESGPPDRVLQNRPQTKPPSLPETRHPITGRDRGTSSPNRHAWWNRYRRRDPEAVNAKQ